MAEASATASNLILLISAWENPREAPWVCTKDCTFSLTRAPKDPPADNFAPPGKTMSDDLFPDATTFDIIFTTLSYEDGSFGSARDWMPPMMTVNFNVTGSSFLEKSIAMSLRSGMEFSTEDARASV